MNGVVTLALLLAKFESPADDCANAVFTVSVVGLSVIVMVTLLPAAMAPRLQLMLVPTVVHVPCVVATDETVAPVTESLAATAGALTGPRLVTTSEYAAFWPAMTLAWPAVRLTATSGAVTAAG